MKNVSVMVIALFAIILSASSCDSKMGGGKIKTDQDSASYAIGILEGSRLAQGLEGIPGGYNAKTLLAAYMVALQQDSGAMKMTVEEAQEFLQNYFPRIQEKEATANLEASAKFLEENKTKKGVQVTESGLQYEVITQGEGALPDSSSVVKVHYVGTTISGDEFDSSISRGEPATFGVTQVIKGWTEALLLMPVGSKYKLFIPSDLAYGERGGGGKIQGNMALVFEVELLEIIAPEGGQQ